MGLFRRTIARFRKQTPSIKDQAPQLKQIPPPPKVGDEIYVETFLHLHRGRDDVRGGRARVITVHHGYHGVPGVFVAVAEHPDALYPWDLLGPQQQRLAQEFRDRRAHRDPDLRPEFNDDWP